jgi:hypothetical protein
VKREKCGPKLTGGAVELGNFIVGGGSAVDKTDYEASRLLLSKVDGLPRRSRRPDESGWYGLGSYFTTNSLSGGRQSQDWGRKYLRTNGGCIYIDLNHLELATPEVRSAREYEAAWSAMLRIARRAQEAANAELAPDSRIVVLANNSDRQGHSYGGHHSFLVSREAFDNMLRERVFPSLFYLSAFQVSSIVFAGQGKVGSENGEPDVPYQISQRADFIECLLGEQTTYHRPLVNTRDEPLCGPQGSSGAPPDDNRYARLHVIFYDTNLAPVATYLKVGVMQLVLTMIEADYIDPDLLLERPLDALHEWSRDPDCEVVMPLLSGRAYTAVELQLRFLEQARAFDAKLGFEGIVPDSEKIMALWEDTLLKLAARDFESLRGRVDWIMKRALIEQALAEHSGWGWDSSEVTYLDQIYSSIDPEEGLFPALHGAGLFEQVASESAVTHLVDDPPDDTRAWIRAMLLRAAGPGRVASVDWDKLELQGVGVGGGRTSLHLADPLGPSRAEIERMFLEASDFASLVNMLRADGIVTISDAEHSGPSMISNHWSYELN